MSSCEHYSERGMVSSLDYNHELMFTESFLDGDFENIVLAVHGYNDYKNSFKLSSYFLKEFNIRLISFDLQGFGKNNNMGQWFDLGFHVNDVKSRIKIIKNKFPNKKIYLIGESMGGAIVLTLANLEKNLPIDGIILVAPAIWNFTEQNFLKSLTMNFLSKLFPNLRVSGKGIIKIKASDNIEMLEELSKDPFFIHKPNFNSLYGIIKLMDESYENAESYFINPNYKTLLLIPIKDEVVPRKPLLELLDNSKENIYFQESINLSVHESNYHMMLRDYRRDFVLEEIKRWIINEKQPNETKNFRDSIKILQKKKFYHILD